MIRPFLSYSLISSLTVGTYFVEPEIFFLSLIIQYFFIVVYIYIYTHLFIQLIEPCLYKRIYSSMSITFFFVTGKSHENFTLQERSISQSRSDISNLSGVRKIIVAARNIFFQWAIKQLSCLRLSQIYP